MDSDDPATTFQTIHHGLGVRPIMVEVQVMSPTTGFIYPGVKSAFAGNDDNERGGVISVYDDNDIRLYGATNSGTLQGKAYIINTGVISWTSENQEQSTTGYVRVRVWLPNDLPSPSYTTTLNMKAGNTYWNDYEERSHGLGSIPVLTIVQYTPAWTVPLTGWVSEGTGSSSRPINNPNLYWGGLVYGVDSQDIRLWAPSYGQANYGIFSFCDGWGYDVGKRTVHTGGL
ncbi:uncharacterized protein LOC132760132 [Ruditapes philippinarum]|uniref:uncharacterized protein LOC132760132 n=1 Tax=Ruditapes philippinarum TaxID=129788 RepID=UPI00295C2F83|nr:uncharacterized protein LOC132760132 [Ruditapes philippinarum]